MKRMFLFKQKAQTKKKKAVHEKNRTIIYIKRTAITDYLFFIRVIQNLFFKATNSICFGHFTVYESMQRETELKVLSLFMFSLFLKKDEWMNMEE